MSKYILFDAYGTLFDLASALSPISQMLGQKTPLVLDRWRTLQLDHAWLSALGNQYVNFETATRSAFTDALSQHGFEDKQRRELMPRLMSAFENIQAYPDAKQCLEALNRRGDVLAILSNGTERMLESATASAGIAHLLEKIISVNAIKTYKPAPQAYALGTNYTNTAPGEVTFVSSNWWDVVGARNFGYQTVWINRGQTPWPESMERPPTTLPNLSALTDV